MLLLIACFEMIVSDVNFLEFIRLGTTDNVVKKVLAPADDSISADINIPNGFAFDESSQTEAFVSNSVPFS